jgi:predicted nuclease of predicted toxin-antitoxin system
VNPPKFLLDENLSPSVAIALRARGIDAAHVRDRGATGASDIAVFALAYNEDRVLVTSNVDDFVALAGSLEVHAGLVLVEDGGLRRDEQLRVVTRAISLLNAEIDGGHDMVNRVCASGAMVRMSSSRCPDRRQPARRSPDDSDVRGVEAVDRHA